MPALQEAIEAAKREGKTPFFVGATAGTTVTGAFDPLEAMAQVRSDICCLIDIHNRRLSSCKPQNPGSWYAGVLVYMGVRAGSCS